MSQGAGKPPARTRKQEDELRAFALSFPETREDRPWGHAAFKVRNKTFLFTTADGDGLGLSVKLVASNLRALDLPYTEPTGYGLGKHGWVSARFGPSEPVPTERIKEWITESFCAIAPKTLLKRLESASSAVPSVPKRKPIPRAQAKPKPSAKPKAARRRR